MALLPEARARSNLIFAAMRFKPVLPVLALLWGACGEKPAKPATETFRSETLHLSMEIPSGWEKVMPGGDSLHVVQFMEPLSDSNDRYRETLKIWVEDIPFPLTDSMYQLAAITQIRLANPGLQVDSLPMLKLNSGTFGRMRLRFANANGDYTVQALTHLHGKFGYNVSLAAEASQQQRADSLLQQLIKTFKPLP